MIEDSSQTDVFETAPPPSPTATPIKNAAMPVLVYADERSSALVRRYTKILAVTGFIFGSTLVAFRIGVLIERTRGLFIDAIYLLIFGSFNSLASNTPDTAHTIYDIIQIALPIILLTGSVFTWSLWPLGRRLLLLHAALSI